MRPDGFAADEAQLSSLADSRAGAAQAPAPVGVAVVGMGWVGRRHAVIARSSRRSHLVSVVDTDPVALDAATARLRPVRAHRDWRACLEDKEVHAVVVATPPQAREDICAAAVAAGKAVLVEKPVTVDLDSMRRLVARCRGGTAQVAYHARHSWDLVQLRDQLRAGAVGRVVSIQVTGAVRRPVQPGSWYFDPARGGGVVSESLGHTIDLVRWLLDTEFASVSAEWCRAQVGSAVFDHTVALVGRLANGAVAAVACSFGGAPAAGVQHSLQVIGVDGVVDFDTNRQPGRHATVASNGVPVSVHPDRGDPPVGALAGQWASFLDAVAGLRPPAPDLDDALTTMEVLHAVSLAAAEGGRVVEPPARVGAGHA